MTEQEGGPEQPRDPTRPPSADADTLRLDEDIRALAEDYEIAYCERDGLRLAVAEAEMKLCLRRIDFASVLGYPSDEIHTVLELLLTARAIIRACNEADAKWAAKP